MSNYGNQYGQPPQGNRNEFMNNRIFGQHQEQQSYGGTGGGVSMGTGPYRTSESMINHQQPQEINRNAFIMDRQFTSMRPNAGMNSMDFSNNFSNNTGQRQEISNVHSRNQASLEQIQQNSSLYTYNDQKGNIHPSQHNIDRNIFNMNARDKKQANSSSIFDRQFDNFNNIRQPSDFHTGDRIQMTASRNNKGETGNRYNRSVEYNNFNNFGYGRK